MYVVVLRGDLLMVFSTIVIAFCAGCTTAFFSFMYILLLFVFELHLFLSADFEAYQVRIKLGSHKDYGAKFDCAN